jgi:hypothetical protein
LYAQSIRLARRVFEDLLTLPEISFTQYTVRRRQWINFVVVKLTAALCWCLISGCGNDLEIGTGDKGGVLRFGDDEHPLQFGAARGGKSGSRPVENTTVQGNIFNLRPATSRPLVAFAFVNLRDPGVFQDFDDAEVGTVVKDRIFRVTHLAAGDLTVVFLLDNAGVNQDGTIDPGDPIATFQDPQRILHNLSANTEVTLEDVDLTFNLNAPDTGTATVQSNANIIVIQRLPSPESPAEPLPSPAGITPEPVTPANE